MVRQSDREGTLADDAPGTATATVTGTAKVAAPILAVPTLDLGGLLALGMILAAAALYRLRARRVSPDPGTGR